MTMSQVCLWHVGSGQGAFHVNSTPEICQHNAKLTIDSIVICQTHAGYLRTFVHRMHPGALGLIILNHDDSLLS